MQAHHTPVCGADGGWWEGVAVAAGGRKRELSGEGARHISGVFEGLSFTQAASTIAAAAHQQPREQVCSPPHTTSTCNFHTASLPSLPVAMLLQRFV